MNKILLFALGGGLAVVIAASTVSGIVTAFEGAAARIIQPHNER